MTDQVAQYAQVTHDRHGTVRLIRHAHRPFTGGGNERVASAMPMSARKIADEYVREQIADLVEIDRGMLRNFDAPAEGHAQRVRQRVALASINALPVQFSLLARLDNNVAIRPLAHAIS